MFTEREEQQEKEKRTMKMMMRRGIRKRMIIRRTVRIETKVRMIKK